MLTLTQKQVSDLEAFINELPVKYGVPLLNLIQSFVKENQEAKKENIKSEVSALKVAEIEAE